MEQKDYVRIKSIRSFVNSMYNHHYVTMIIKWVETDNSLYLEKIKNYGSKGNGKVALLKLFEYMEKRGYTKLTIRVYPIEAIIGNASRIDVEKLVSYYEGLGFVLNEPVPKTSTIPNAIEMTKRIYENKELGFV